jgi:hypothetical protein
MCVQKLPSQKSSTSLPATVLENLLDAWLMTSPLGTPRGRCDEYSSKIFPQLRNQGLSIRRGANKRLKVMFDSLVTLQQERHFTTKQGSASSASSNVEPAHNTTKYFVPNLR